MLSLRHRRLQTERAADRGLRLAVRGDRVPEFQILLGQLENVVLQRTVRALLRDELFARVRQLGDGLRFDVWESAKVCVCACVCV